MGDVQLSSEPTRNLIVSSTTYQTAPQEEHLAPDQQSSAIVTPESSTTGRRPSSSQTSSANSSAMAVPLVQQSQHAANQPRYQGYIPVSYTQPRATSIGHGASPAAFSIVNMQRALPVYPSPQQQQGAQAPPQAPRFQAGLSPAPLTYQIPQPVPQFQNGAGVPIPGGGQYYHVPGFSQPYFDHYTQHYIHTSVPQGQQDPQSQQQQGTFYTSYPPQHPQSAGPTQSHFGAPWLGQPQAGYYYIHQDFSNHPAPTQHISMTSQQHQQHVQTGSYVRRHSVPARGPPPKRRGSETDASVFVGYNGVPHWERNANYVQPSRGPVGQNHSYPATSFPTHLELPQSNSSGTVSGAATNVTTPTAYDVTSPSSLHPGMPRGPPRKPKQSGHALWVGNLPTGTAVLDLKEYFSRDAKDDIESVFLISKSNCAFVNYRTELSCSQAMERFHDSKFQSTRLVCRLRRSSATSTAGVTTPSPDPSADQSAQTSTSGDEGNKDGEEEDAPVESIKNPPIGPAGARAPSRESGRDRFFIVKSLTVEDLDLSVRNGIWATQNHNETALNRAFETADNVYLIFSANKSGEYYGYARMTSPILDDPSNVIEWTPSTQQLDDPDLPKAIYTPATDNAPQGRIIDDSARGTIFWEALSDDEAPDNKKSNESGEKSALVSKSWGKPFKVEWMSTSRVPFYRTRGLRNLWNANREVKIARDGTELEETVGKRLINMFHRNNNGVLPPVMAGGHILIPQPTPHRSNAVSH